MRFNPYGEPTLYSSGVAESLKRLPYDTGAYNEEWLQTLLAAHPEVLPIGTLMPDYAPAVCIGREVMTSEGHRLDNLYLSPSGNLTLVETKLWRNPEARRKVVSQVLEYLREISSWDYEELEKRTGKYIAKSTGASSLYEAVSAADDSPSEPDFISRTSRCLDLGRVLCLIVGDGIHTQARDLVDVLNQSPDLQFNLNFVELAVFEFPGAGTQQFIVIPRLLSRTEEIPRAIVRVELVGELKEKATVEVRTPRKQEVKAGARTKLSEADFLESVRSNVGAELAVRIEQLIEHVTAVPGVAPLFRQRNMTIRYTPETEAAVELSVLSIEDSGMVWNGGWLAPQLEKNGIPRSEAYEFWASLNAINSGFNPEGTSHLSKHYVPASSLGADIAKVEEAVMGFLQTIKRYEGEMQ